MAIQYASQTITITATTLASGAARQSTSVATDNTLNVDDYRINVKAAIAAGTPAGSKAVFVWVFTSNDGTNWDGNAGASDAAITLDSPHQFTLGTVIPFPASTLTRQGSFSLKAACGGSIPESWGIIIENQVGFAFTSCTVTCDKIYYT